MPSPNLRGALEEYVEQAAIYLREERHAGAELPYDVIESGSRGGGTPLYCYRPMTAEFIRDRRDCLEMLPAHLPAVRALSEIEGLERYLRARGARRVASDPRTRAETVLACLVSELFDDVTDFELSTERLQGAYSSLESALFAGHTHVELIAGMGGIEVESEEVVLGEGLSLLAAETLDDPPPELSDADPMALVLLRWSQRPTLDGATLISARARLAGLLTPLRLFGDADVGLDPIGWLREDGGPWRPVELEPDVLRRSTPAVLAVSAMEEDELRAFCNLIARRRPRGGEIAWALRRFEMGCDRARAADALTDYLLALRALLEPEGPASGQLPGRLAALCAVPAHRAELAARMAHAVSLERAVIAGLAPAESGVQATVEELGGHVRALLRDVLCGHLDADLRGVADELIAQQAGCEETGEVQPLELDTRG